MLDQIKKDLIKYMKEQDKFKLDVIRMLKSAIQMESINLKHDLSDAKIIHDKISKIDSPSIKDMGIIIKEISQEYGAQVDMSKVSKLVKEKLS